MSKATENRGSGQPPLKRDRRKHYRATVVARSALRAKVWLVESGVPLRRSPMPSEEIKLIVRQIGLGGLTIEASMIDDRLVALRKSDRLRIEVAFGKSVMVMEGRLRARIALLVRKSAVGATAAAVGPIRAGVIFQGRESDVNFREARATLATIVAAVQREELRDRRNGEPVPEHCAA